MKATGIVRRVDNPGRSVISREICRALHIRVDDPLHTILTSSGLFCWGHIALQKK